MSVCEELYQIQLEQQTHDQKYHQDVCALPIRQRFEHITLHFCKYSGRVAESYDRNDTEVLNRTITDIFIKCVDCANMLDYSLSDEIPFADNESIETLEDLGKILSNNAEYNFSDSSWLIKSLAIHSGRLAKVCESLYPIDAYPYRDEIIDNVADISSATLVAAYKRDIKINIYVKYCLMEAEVKSIFHAYI